MVHDPGVYPEMSVNAVIVQPNQDVIIKVEPMIVESTNNVRSLPTKQRQCSFPDEVIGKLFFLPNLSIF